MPNLPPPSGRDPQVLIDQIRKSVENARAMEDMAREHGLPVLADKARDFWHAAEEQQKALEEKGN